MSETKMLTLKGGKTSKKTGVQTSWKIKYQKHTPQEYIDSIEACFDKGDAIAKTDPGQTDAFEGKKGDKKTDE